MADLNTVIPDFGVSITNPDTGQIDPIWYQFLLQMFNRTQTLLDVPGSISNFMVYQSVAQAVTATTQTPITFTSEVFDDNSEYSVVTSTFSPIFAGTYVFSAGIFGSQAAATRRQLSLYVNGVVRAIMQDSTGNTGACCLAGCSAPVNLSAGDLVIISYYSGIAENTAASPTGTYFGGWRIK